jgi:hypothetical protein
MNSDERLARLVFGAIYPLYVAKVERKGRTREELDAVLQWALQVDDAGLRAAVAAEWTFAELFDRMPLHPDTAKITGTICGYRVENIENPTSQKVRYLDKIVDELAKGWSLEKIKRLPTPAKR